MITYMQFYKRLLRVNTEKYVKAYVVWTFQKNDIFISMFFTKEF